MPETMSRTNLGNWGSDPRQPERALAAGDRLAVTLSRGVDGTGVIEARSPENAVLFRIGSLSG